MIDVALQYGLFLAQTVTLVAALAFLVAFAAGVSRRRGAPERLEVEDLNRRYDELERRVRSATLPARIFKSEEKARRKEDRRRAKAPVDESRRRLFVLSFRGDIKASGVQRLREEVTAVLGSARTSDEVVVRLENAGGLVHEHGLAASQLLRIRARGIPLTVAVDKVAASGGYLMACVADRVVAAPFAILGSIGVLMQLPNLHRLLDAHGIDFEQIKGGEFKRTLTVFGENTDADRDKASADVADVHALFKSFVAEHRPSLDVDRVATGEHWYGVRALELGLCDDLTTSDDYLLAARADADLLELHYRAREPMAKKLAGSLARGAGALLERVAELRHARGFAR